MEKIYSSATTEDSPDNYGLKMRWIPGVWSMVSKEESRKRLERLAWYLDSSVKIPVLKARFGVDALLGLIPGVGDTIGAMVSIVIILEAARLGAPKVVLLKMAVNILLDTVIGTIPILGDLLDFVLKANQRNVQLLNSYLDKPGETIIASQWFVWSLVVLLVGSVLSAGLIGFVLLRALLNAVAGS